MLDKLDKLVNIKAYQSLDRNEVEALISLDQRAWVETHYGLALHRDTGAPLSREECRRFTKAGYRRRRLEHWTTMPGENALQLLIYAWSEDGASCTDQVVGYVKFDGHEATGFTVDPLFQGQGYGRQLYKAALMLGVGDQPIMVRPTRGSNAHRFAYPSLGFVPTNREFPSWSSTDDDDDPPVTVHCVELMRPANAPTDNVFHEMDHS
jgi:GNAT superfamily N-acetyltransferase